LLATCSRWSQVTFLGLLHLAVLCAIIQSRWSTHTALFSGKWQVLFLFQVQVPYSVEDTYLTPSFPRAGGHLDCGDPPGLGPFAARSLPTALFWKVPVTRLWLCKILPHMS
jgi:hypothetical protein